MAKFRQDRVNDAVMLEVSQIIREVKDPRVSDQLITITGANVTADLKYAKIFFSILDGDEKEASKGLKSASGFIRGQLSKRLNLRITPEVSFIYDNSVQRGVEIAAILNTLDTPLLESESEDD